jgi:hypothetical protein
MKIPVVLLATVLYLLLMLLWTDSSPTSLPNNQERVSEVLVQFVLKR